MATTTDRERVVDVERTVAGDRVGGVERHLPWVLTRGPVLAGLAAAFATLTFTASDPILRDLSAVFIFAIGALSINLLMGYAGQISLGHHALFGIGAFTTAGIADNAGFLTGVVVAALAGAGAAALLGAVALRLRGLYLALITLAFGFFAEAVIFRLRGFAGGVAGVPAPRPAGFESDLTFLWLTVGFFAFVQFLDWRLVESKTGRAIRALRENERVAASLGVNVTVTKVFAFVLSGAFAGLAGALFAHRAGFTSAEDFNLQLGLTFVFVAVVGGLGSRLGVFVAAAFFTLLQSFPDRYGWFDAEWTPFIGAALLVLTLALHPGGIADLLRPISRWFTGNPTRRREA